MAEFTNSNGTPVVVTGGTVQRIRRTVYGEDSEANTRIDATRTLYVIESVAEVADSIRAENENFTHLNSRDGSEIWFNAKKVAGPMAITPSMQESGFNSSIKLKGYRQYVSQTHEEVIEVISQAGGSPLPPPSD